MLGLEHLQDRRRVLQRAVVRRDHEGIGGSWRAENSAALPVPHDPLVGQLLEAQVRADLHRYGDSSAPKTR
jgi:hypothetical protein